MRFTISRLALIACAGSVLAACSTTGEVTPAYPITAPAPAPEPEPPPPPPPPPPQENGVVAVPTQPVTSQPLAPPSAAPIPREDPLPPAQTYTPPPGAAAAAPPVTVFSVTGRVVDAEGPPRVHVVKSGDTIDAIARSFGITRTQLAQANDLESPYLIRPGQRLTGPRSRAKAYTVASGDTLFAISRRFGVTPAAIAEANDMEVNAAIRPNQRLILPDGFKDAGPLRRTVAAPPPPPPAPAPAYTPPPPAPMAAYVPPPAPAAAPAPAPAAAAPAAPPPVAAVAPRPPAPAAPVAAAPRPAAPATPAVPPMVDSSAVPTDAQVAAAGRGKFIWPIQGEVLSTFGPKSTGQRNDGVNIRTAPAAPIRAAAAGEVVYAGDQVPEFGNLVLIKHEDGWVTAYAHLSRADVRMRQTVTQGQTIGTAGMSGGVSEPQLHFEVRYAPTVRDRARPIDPQLVLPR